MPILTDFPPRKIGHYSVIGLFSIYLAKEVVDAFTTPLDSDGLNQLRTTPLGQSVDFFVRTKIAAQAQFTQLSDINWSPWYTFLEAKSAQWPNSVDFHNWIDENITDNMNARTIIDACQKVVETWWD